MLIRDIERSIEELNKTKQDMMETSDEFLKLSIELKNQDIAIIDEQLANPTEETDVEQLQADKERLLNEIEQMKLDNEKDKAELDEIGKDLVIKPSRYAHIYDLLEDLDETIDKLNSKLVVEGPTKMTMEEKNKLDKYQTAKSMIYDTVSFERLSNDRSFNLTKKFLKENYSKFSKEVQRRLGKDSKYVYPSCYQIKRSIANIIATQYPEKEEKEINSLSKVYASFLLNHILKVDLAKEGIYVYYLINNIYNVESLPIDKYFEFRTKLLSILERL